MAYRTREEMTTEILELRKTARRFGSLEAEVLSLRGHRDVLQTETDRLAAELDEERTQNRELATHHKELELQLADSKFSIDRRDNEIANLHRQLDEERVEAKTWQDAHLQVVETIFEKH